MKYRAATRIETFMLYFCFSVCCFLILFAVITVPRAIESDFNFKYTITGEL
jgi:hypothetical protein